MWRLWHIARWGLGIFLVLAIVGWMVLDREIRLQPLPEFLENELPTTTILLDRNDEPFFVVGNKTARDCRPISLASMGLVPAMTIGIEDRRFYSHPGVDVLAMFSALMRSFSQPTGGASTVTQQLVKLTSPPRQRTVSTKWHEALVALRLEREWSKEKILENYLNRLDYGNRRIGPEAAAQAYFGHPAYLLTLSEAIFLAGLPQSPTRFNPWKDRVAADCRYRANVERLAKRGLLPVGIDAKILAAAPPRIFPTETMEAGSSFADATQGATSLLGMLHTTFDPHLQKMASAILDQGLAQAAAFSEAVIVIVENATGYVRAVATNSKYGDLNPAFIKRSCGSTLKPFLYVAGIEQRVITAASLLPDTPNALAEEYSDYAPKNFSQRYLGPVRAREALGNSLNVPAVVLLSRLGARDTFDAMRRWGLELPSGFDAWGAGFILGNVPVSPIELAGAYATLARGGQAWSPMFLRGQVYTPITAASRPACAIVTDILSDPLARRKSFGDHSPLELPWRAAAKTGTSSGFRDTWCCGFDGEHTVVVWTGCLDGHPMPALLAIRSAAPLWAATMKMLAENGSLPLPPIASGEEIRSCRVSALSGLIPDNSEKAIVTEWFLPGTEPQKLTSSQMRDGKFVLPAEYYEWCASAANTIGAVAAKEPLRIIYPTDGATFIINPALKKKQSFAPQSTDPQCRWILDGHPLSSPLIPLTAGSHRLEATSPEGNASITFIVEGE